MAEPNDEAGTAPEFNVVTVDELLGLFGRLAVAAADKRFVSYEVPVSPNLIRPILCHPSPFTIGVFENTIPMGNSDPLTDWEPRLPGSGLRN